MRLESLLDTPLVRGALDFFFPPLCLGCGEFCDSDHDICERCLSRIDLLTFPVCINCGAVVPRGRACPECGPRYVPLCAYANYQPPLKDIIIQYKFKGLTSPAAFFAARLYDEFADIIDPLRADALVPIPLHPSRENTRGYNQAALFARALGRVIDLPVTEDLIIRTRRRAPQARIDRESRERNIRGVFEPVDSERAPLRVIVVDDVVTTGATVREARRVLESGHHVVVGAVAMAHGV